MFSLPTVIAAALTLASIATATPAQVSILSLDTSGQVESFYAQTDGAQADMQNTYSRVVWATTNDDDDESDAQKQLAFEQVDATFETVVLQTLVTANDDLVKYLEDRNMIYHETEPELVGRSGPCGGLDPGRKRDFSMAVESGRLEKRQSRCGQFCGGVRDCTGDAACPRCHYTGGRCNHQRSCAAP